jgi:hypothetical protein
MLLAQILACFYSKIHVFEKRIQAHVPYLSKFGLLKVQKIKNNKHPKAQIS